jgi:hypothetical protein
LRWGTVVARRVLQDLRPRQRGPIVLRLVQGWRVSCLAALAVTETRDTRRLECARGEERTTMRLDGAVIDDRYRLRGLLGRGAMGLV